MSPALREGFPEQATGVSAALATQERHPKGVPNTQLAKVTGCFSESSLHRLSKDIDDRQEFHKVL
ncbi:hypothetical protein [Nostoc sp.]|uniref:hypothetical protein n=1 Tax=Nostoc sp. TaxID=1180 RepID=UPI002FF8AB31